MHLCPVVDDQGWSSHPDFKPCMTNTETSVYLIYGVT